LATLQTSVEVVVENHQIAGLLPLFPYATVIYFSTSSVTPTFSRSLVLFVDNLVSGYYQHSSNESDSLPYRPLPAHLPSLAEYCHSPQYLHLAAAGKHLADNIYHSTTTSTGMEKDKLLAKQTAMEKHLATKQGKH